MTKPRILIVDDDPQVIDTMKAMLAGMPFCSHCTTNGSEVLSLMESFNPSVVILDIFMPSPDGLDLCRAIKENPSWRSIPVVFITGIASAEEKIQSYREESLPDAILHKPVSRSGLLITIRAMLRMHEQVHQLEDALQQQRKIEELRDNLINMLAHDMRHPLQSIYGFCSFLDGTLRSNFSVEELAGKIKSHAFRLNQMLQNLLDVGKLESKRMPLFWEETSIISCLNACYDRLINDAFSHGVSLQIFSDNPDFTFVADKMLLGRILDNLVNNAVKFSPGGEKIILGGAPDFSQENVVFCVEDHGPGIEEQYKKKIFEKYGAAGINIEHDRPSYGLGLAFCKLAVQAHGGEIWVENRIQGGCVFKFNIPIKSEINPSSDDMTSSK